MKEFFKKIWNKIRTAGMYVWRKKRLRYPALILIVVVLYLVFRGGTSTAGVVTDTVKRQDLIRTVLATGQVSSTTDLNLSFTTSGVVSRVAVATGQKVKKGDVLATLDQKSAYANYTSARGALLSAKANLQKTIEGVSNEEIAVAQVALDNAKKDLEITTLQQDTLVRNARRALLNSGLALIPVVGNTTLLNPIVSGAYSGEVEGAYTLSFSSNRYFSVRGISTGSGIVTASYPQQFGNEGLFVEFPAGFSEAVNANDTWVVTIPNTQASTYTTNLNAYNASLQTRASAINSAQSIVSADEATLAFKKRTARPVEVDAAQADVLSAEGKMQSAAAILEDTTLRAPADGTITKVDIKVGELAQALKEVMVLQDIGNLYLEANINEANIAEIKNDQLVDVTFDALGTDKTFIATISKIDPSSTLISGVVNYKIEARITAIPEIRPGMTANMSILVGQISGVLAVPKRAVLTHDNSSFVRVVKDPTSKKLTWTETRVTTGFEGDEGLVEIKTGLEAGQPIVVFVPAN